MPFALDPYRSSPRERSVAVAELDAALGAAEVAIYLSTAGMPERAGELLATAHASGLVSRVRRARLIRSDALSRRGELESALREQLAVLADAERDGDRQICARAHCQLASTYDRLADVPQSQASAAAGVHLLEPSDPLAWQAEHTMVLALFTSYRERIRTQMQASDWGPLAGRLVVTVSIGLALDAQGTAEASELLSRADSALYEAKRHGRNRVVAVSDAQAGRVGRN